MTIHFTFILLTHVEPPTCSPNQFRCDSGQCIHQSLRCNRRYDCRDGSDEFHCGEWVLMLLVCRRLFVVPTYKTVHKYWLCCFFTGCFLYGIFYIKRTLHPVLSVTILCCLCVQFMTEFIKNSHMKYINIHTYIYWRT